MRCFENTSILLRVMKGVFMSYSPYSIEERFSMITDCLKSGLSISMWCREHDIPVGTFYSWISQVKIVRASARTLARISYEILV